MFKVSIRWKEYRTYEKPKSFFVGWMLIGFWGQSWSNRGRILSDMRLTLELESLLLGVTIIPEVRVQRVKWKWGKKNQSQ